MWLGVNMIEFIEDILKLRDKYKQGSSEWNILNIAKARTLEDLKSSWAEKVAYCYSSDLKDINNGFTTITHLPKIEIHEEKRSLLEYNGGYTRHIIPYCLVRYENEYYFVLRENNSDNRLNNKYGLLGGHTSKNIESGMFRELQEEAEITLPKIKNIQIIGIIKSGDEENTYDVSLDHIGLVYLIELKHKRVRMLENGVQKGVFVHRDEMHKYSENFENWLDLVYKNYLCQ
jgi:predicted NUDIX family phosphoesterase